MKHLLFTPSGVNVPPLLHEAGAASAMSHRSPHFTAVLQDVRRLVVQCLEGTAQHEAIMLASSGTGALEAALGAVDGPVLVILNGRYSTNLASIAAAVGHEVRTVRVKPFGAVYPGSVAAVLDGDPAIRTLAFVHCETTTGTLAPLASLCKVAANRGVVTVVDAIGSAGAHDLHLRSHGPDWVALTSGKAVEGLPGLAFVVTRRDLLDGGRMRRRGFYLDLLRHWERQRTGSVAHTVPVPLVSAVRIALQRWERETPKGRHRRYAATAAALRDGLRDREFELVPLPPGQQSDVVVPVQVPPGMDFVRVQAELLCSGLEIYHDEGSFAQGYFFLAALGPLEQADLEAFLDALRSACRRCTSTRTGGTIPGDVLQNGMRHGRNRAGEPDVLRSDVVTTEDEQQRTRVQ
jgi:2-aminoethylphosphonate-pyruvate transaminase